jgi:hypothetical protein
VRIPLLAALGCGLVGLGCMPVDLGGALEVGGVNAGTCVPFARDAKPFVPPAIAPPPARPCPDAASLRARVEPLLNAGYLDRSIRLLSRTAETCPSQAAASADLLASARASLEGLLGDPDTVLAHAREAQWHGEDATARSLLDAALASAEREQGTRAVVRGRSEHGRDADDVVKLLRFSPDGERLVAAGAKKLTLVWSLRTGHLERGVIASSTPGLFEPWILALSADGRVAANRHDETLELWSTDDGSLLRGLSGHEKSSQYSQELDSAAFSNSGRYVATGDELGTLRVFRVADGERVLSYDAQQSRLVAVSWSPGDRLIATASRNESAVRLRDAATGLTVSVLGTEEDELHHLLWSADARVLVAADLFREIRVWDLATCRSTRIDDWPPCHVFEDGSCGGLALFGLAVSPSGDRVFGVFDDDGVVVWDAASGQRLAWWKLPANDRAWGGTVSADGRLFAVGAASGVQVFRISGGALAPLVSLAVSKGTSGEDGYVLDNVGWPSPSWPQPTGYYDASGWGASELRCVIGAREWPLAVCADRLHVRGLLAKRAAGAPIGPEDTGE